MAAIRMQSEPCITVLINPFESENSTKTKSGVYLTMSYDNPSGVLPQEHIFVSNNEQWFYWLGYHNNWQDFIPEFETETLEKVFNYVDQLSSENQIELYRQSQCNRCGKQDTLFCQMSCPVGAM